MTKLSWNLWDDLDRFDLGHSGARPSVWRDCKALYLEKTGIPVLLRDELPFECYRLQAEVAIPGPVGFIGFAFGARDFYNYELVYLAPVEIQYDPAMNGSMTWQIYNGPFYQKPLPDTTGKWHKFTVDVQPGGATVYLNDHPEPQLVISNLQHGGSRGKIGVWGYLPSYIRNLSVEELEPALINKHETDIKQLKDETFVTEWMVSKPYPKNGRVIENQWIKERVEVNGTLNLNRLYAAEQDISVQVKSTFHIPEEKETRLSFGYSDHLRLWINEEEVYQGDWRWNPPESDGRIRSDAVSIPVRWKAGQNTIRAEITNNEHFGWGLSVKTGLHNMTFI